MEHNKLEDWICLQNQDCFLLPPPKNIYSLEPPQKKIDLVDVANNDDLFFRVISKGCWALTLSPCLKRRDPLSGEPTKSFRNIGKLRRDLTFVRVSQENMGRTLGGFAGY